MLETIGDSYVLYLVARKSLNLSPGKLAAQAGHAVGMIYEHKDYLVKEQTELEQRIILINKPYSGYSGCSDDSCEDLEEKKEKKTLDEQLENEIRYLTSDLDQFKIWAKEAHRKIVKKASDTEFNRIKADFGGFVVTDAGYTEVEPGTETVLALWPMLKSDTPKIIHKLQLY